VNSFKRFPATLVLLLVNVVVFALSYLRVHTFSEPEWTLNLLSLGAEFNPYTLDQEWYRLFTHLFLHGSILHLVFNMVALFAAGKEVEQEVGTKKFLWVYFLSGVAAALTSLYWSLFTIGVGASGAIFGLFGFSLIINLASSRKEDRPVTPIIVNFVIFLGINLLFANAFKADTAAHLGGLACGMIIGMVSLLFTDSLRTSTWEIALIPLLVTIYFSLPRYQVSYFKFFQQVLAVEDSTQNLFSRKNLSDEAFVEGYKKGKAQWDTTLILLRAHAYLPKALHSDTAKLARYIALRKQEAGFRITLIERESYIYRDSLDIIQESMKSSLSLDYPLMMVHQRPKQPEPLQPKEQLAEVQVWYNGDWEELAGPPGAYYRIGSKDSLDRWQGPVTDFFANGDIQMKGSYKDNEHEGIFIYYSDHKTYVSAGRYKGDRHVGKWESFHDNGMMESEVYYDKRYFLKNLWDAHGNQLVHNGNGKEVQRYANGVIKTEGEYRDGHREGYWYGRRETGELYYEENFYRGRLVNGRSRSREGRNFIYDESSLSPLPEGGYKKLSEYIQGEVKKVASAWKGTVRLSFRVTAHNTLTEFKVEKSVSTVLDEQARHILLAGPRWISAKEHGQEVTDGYAFVNVEF
jgi:membrane associated rhomboid family serine protease/antitoxin component YwqK of YwqJK toxin-antitoxin module